MLLYASFRMLPLIFIYMRLLSITGPLFKHKPCFVIDTSVLLSVWHRRNVVLECHRIAVTNASDVTSVLHHDAVYSWTTLWVVQTWYPRREASACLARATERACPGPLHPMQQAWTNPRDRTPFPFKRFLRPSDPAQGSGRWAPNLPMDPTDSVTTIARLASRIPGSTGSQDLPKTSSD